MCTRLLYKTETGQFITARGMDWNDPTAATSMVVYPRGMQQSGGNMDNPLTWTSKYGSVFASFYNVACADGINEAGLVTNALYLAESDYGDYTLSQKPRLSIGAWAQYFLDNFATVEEAVTAMKQPPFVIVAPLLPNGRAATVHLSLSDISGDSAILEYVDGELKIHHSAEYRVMTNSPLFDEQIAINKYWESVGGDKMLPGTINAADRFVRATYLLNSTPRFPDGQMATAAALSVLRSVGVPLGMADSEHPNISATLWRSISDHKAKRFFLDSASQPALIWLDLNNVNLEPGAPVMTVELNGPEHIAGDITDKLVVSEPLSWI
ncbi:linear amide C-N hydrolase [Shewanella gaetbuli]|uniref:Linear amide C-N hydrolase n=1 Tax=Shewanella gaetbuli TaxID=220752 RepID=A0A9X1ZTJ2_9GAMM|nr:linear amide C-N hydrolase [Shewanella gaetbuli]MCL1143818.1 linear amide C-N hydrolase [Shewanella gaetbuli]